MVLLGRECLLEEQSIEYYARRNNKMFTDLLINIGFKVGYVLGNRVPNGNTKEADFLLVDITLEEGLDLSATRPAVESAGGRPVIVVASQKFTKEELSEAGVAGTVNPWMQNITDTVTNLLSR